MSSNEAILSFNSGILSPKVDVRVDTEKYRAGCRRLESMIPEKYGCATKRPGFKYVATSYGSSTVVALMPFVYSSTVVYKIELGNLYMRFYYGDAVLLDGATEVVIDTPYESADLFELQYKQIGDVVWIVHPNYAPRKLKRTDAYTFTLTEIDFRNGPFLTRNDYLDPDNPSTTTLSCTATEQGQYGSLVATAAVFLPQHVGALFKLSHARTVKSLTLTGTGGTTSSSAIHGKGTYNLLTRGTWTGTIVWQRRENNGDWEELFSYPSSANAYQNINKSYVEESDITEHRLYTTDGSTALRADFSIDEPLEAGIVKVVGVGDSYNAVVEVYSKLASTTATVKWFEGSWSAVRGYPASITFFENRCVYAGALSGSASDSTQIKDYPNLLNLTY